MIHFTQGKTTTETFIEEHKDDNAGHLDPDFFKMRIKNFKDAEKKMMATLMIANLLW